jgi:hypothetical protein
LRLLTKNSFADCRCLASVVIENLSVMSEFISVFLRNFDDFNPYFRLFWDHWWSILQQLPIACIKYISRPIRIIPSQDLGLSCDCFEIVLFCKLDRSLIDWNDWLTMFCKSSVFCEFFDLFWKLQFWFQFVSWFDGISRRRLLLQQWKQMILPVFI